MGDNNQKNSNEILNDIYTLLKNSRDSGVLRKDSPSTNEDTLNQLYGQSVIRDKQFNENLKKHLNKINSGFFYTLRKTVRGQRSTSGVLRNLGDITYERLTRRAIKNYLKKEGRDYSQQSIDNFRRANPGFRGSFGTLGFLGTLVNTLAKLAKGVSSVTFLFFVLADILKATAEARKFYLPSIRQGYGQSTTSLYNQSNYTLNRLRNPFIAGAYANNTAFKNAVSEIMSSGVLNDASVKDSEALVKSFRFIASQGLLLGETFDETTKNFINTASLYNLAVGPDKNMLEGFKYVNKIIARGVADGFSKSGLQQLLLQYDKSAAVSQNGLLKAFKDFDVMFKTIGDINPDRNQMPQYLSLFQNLMSGKVNNLSTFAALVDRSGAAYSKSQLNKLAEEYQDSSGFAQKVIAFRNLQKMTGVGTALLTELNKTEFGAFANRLGRNLLDSLTKNPQINRRYMKEASNLSPAEQARWMQENLKDMKISNDQKLAIEKLAQMTEVMSNPLETLVTLVTGIFNILGAWAGSKLLKGLLGDGTINLGDSSRFLPGPTKTSESLKQIKRS